MELTQKKGKNKYLPTVCIFKHHLRSEFLQREETITENKKDKKMISTYNIFKYSKNLYAGFQ